MLALCSGLCMNAFCTVGTSPAMPTFSPRTVQLVTCVRTAGLWESTPAAASLFAHAWATASSWAFSVSAGRPAETRALFVAVARSPAGLASAELAKAAEPTSAVTVSDRAATHLAVRRTRRVVMAYRSATLAKRLNGKGDKPDMPWQHHPDGLLTGAA